MTSRKVVAGLSFLAAVVCGPVAIYIAGSTTGDSTGRLVALTAAGFIPMLMMILSNRRRPAHDGAV